MWAVRDVNEDTNSRHLPAVLVNLNLLSPDTHAVVDQQNMLGVSLTALHARPFSHYQLWQVIEQYSLREIRTRAVAVTPRWSAFLIGRLPFFRPARKLPKLATVKEHAVQPDLDLPCTPVGALGVIPQLDVTNID